MTSWTSYLQLAVTIILVTSFIAGVLFLARTISETVKNTKENLKAKGYHITDNGVQIKTDKRFDREAYIDATQRGFIKSMEASSFRNAAAEQKKADVQAKSPKDKSESWRNKLKRRTTS